MTTHKPVIKTFDDLQRLANVMDSRFQIPGTSISLGLDALVGLIPGVGDTINLGVSAWIVLQSAKLGVRKRVVTRMTFNIFIDWLIGLIPLIGDIFDIGWKANIRNVELLGGELEHQGALIRDVQVLT